MSSVTVIIPTWQGAKYVPRLVAALRRQAVPPSEILVVDSSSTDGTPDIARGLGCRVEVIPKAEFNHGGTRTKAAGWTNTKIIVFMSQDVEPADNQFLGRLVEPLESGDAVASYARQMAHPDAKPTERFLRQFNYPEKASIRHSAGTAKGGPDAFFFSNAASAFLRDTFLKRGGFPSNVILSEDTIMCARLLKAGYSVAYAAEARVLHSHNYTLRQQFRRYFDIGVAYREAADDLRTGAKASRGLRYAIDQGRWFARNGHVLWIPYGAAESAVKFLGYHLGRRHQTIPFRLKRALSMHKGYWRK